MTKPETQWVLVPREPTVEQVAAAMERGAPFGIGALYKAMLASSPPAPSVPDVVKLIEKLRDTEIDDFAIGPTMEAAAAALTAQAAEVERLTIERDLALAHDTQPYPTADAYEKVCAARTAWQARATTAESSLETARGALEQGAKWFREYEKLHNEKRTTDGNSKAWVNSVRATALEQALAALPSPPITKTDN